MEKVDFYKWLHDIYYAYNSYVISWIPDAAEYKLMYSYTVV